MVAPAMECEFVVNGVEEESERQLTVIRTGWESVVFEIEDEPEESLFPP